MDRVASHLRVEGESAWPPSARHVWSWPLPHLPPIDRLLLRSIMLLARHRIHSVAGAAHIVDTCDPFIVAVNHSTRQEAVLVPALLFLLRRGRRVHFLADWNFRMIPGIDLLYRRGGAITVARKSARPRLLNIFKPFLTDAMPAQVQARQHLLAGRSIGLFPEGTVNRNPLQLMRGRLGAARLSAETGVPVVPIGLRFPTVAGGAVIGEDSPLAIEIGAPLRVPPGTVTSQAVWTWHARIMTALGQLSGKSWNFGGDEP